MSAVIVERSCWNACWVVLMFKSSLFIISWTFSKTLPTWGRTEICLKSLTSVGLLTLGTGLTSACLYAACTCTAVYLCRWYHEVLALTLHGIFSGAKPVHHHTLWPSCHSDVSVWLSLDRYLGRGVVYVGVYRTVRGPAGLSILCFPMVL